MNVKEVREIIEKLKAEVHDPETAHGIEDDLYFAVLESIANDPSNAQDLAKEALKTEDIPFEKWYA